MTRCETDRAWQVSRSPPVEAVDATLVEFDEIGREAFLSKYNFEPAKGLYLVRRRQPLRLEGSCRRGDR